MINTSKNSILTYGIIVLLIINIAVIGLVLVQKCNFHKRMTGCPPNKEISQNRCLSEFLEKDLQFSKEQMQQFKELKNEFHPTAKVYFDSLDMLESDFFAELVKPQTDTAKLYSYAYEFGRLQYALKHKTIEHLIKIKLICKPEQQKKYFDHIMKNRHCREGMEIRPPSKHGCPDMMK
jgi:periplasmic protein CpxP/Spy